MNELELMNNEAMEEVVETSATDLNAGLKGAAIGAIATLGGILLFKKVIKPAVAKIKARKKAKAEEKKTTETEEFDFDEHLDSENSNN